MTFRAALRGARFFGVIFRGFCFAAPPATFGMPLPGLKRQSALLGWRGFRAALRGARFFGVMFRGFRFAAPPATFGAPLPGLGEVERAAGVEG